MPRYCRGGKDTDMRIAGYLILFAVANYLAAKLGSAHGKREYEKAKSIWTAILFFSLGIVGGALWFA